MEPEHHARWLPPPNRAYLHFCNRMAACMARHTGGPRYVVLTALPGPTDADFVRQRNYLQCVAGRDHPEPVWYAIPDNHLIADNYERLRDNFIADQRSRFGRSSDIAP